jgi:hypothetical protein
MHAGHGQSDLCNGLTFLLGGIGGERRRLMISISGRPAACLRSQGSDRAANLIVDGEFPPGPGPARVTVCCSFRPSLGLSSPHHGPDQSVIFPMVNGKPATVLCLACGCAAGLPARGVVG